MGFYVKGHSNNMTDLIPEHLEARKNIVIGEYILKSWRFEPNIETESGEKSLKVIMVLFDELPIINIKIYIISPFSSDLDLLLAPFAELS